MRAVYDKPNYARSIRQHKLNLTSINLEKIDALTKVQYKNKKNSIELFITSAFLEDNNYQVSIRGQILILILSEKKEVERPIHVHNLNRDFINNTCYERLRSYEITLPNADYHVVNTFLNPKKHSLAIILNK
jgi:hypothetical protein